MVRMNLKNILIGMAALAAAAFVCGRPLTVCAANGSGTITYFNVDDYNSSGGSGSTGAASGSISYNYSGYTGTNNPFEFGEIYWPNSTSADFQVVLWFYDDATGTTGNSTYNFTYMGNTYSGSIPLSVASFDNTQVYGCISLLTVPAATNVTTATRGLTVQEQAIIRMYQEINDTAKVIANAVEGIDATGAPNPDRTVEYTADALNWSIMKSMLDAPGVTLFFNYTYDGYEYRSAVTPELAAQVYNPDIPWYGPCFMKDNFPTVIVGPVV
ncbi:MAG: hypothetical protein K5871_02680 [Lachnospiraceae bacterium]|nr:hypothetical protein [Lachnospiraceae bacterium]